MIFGKLIANRDMRDLLALMTWVALFAISVYITNQQPEAPEISLFSSFFCFYALGYLIGTCEQCEHKLRWLALVLMLFSAFACGWILQFGYLSILTIIWVAVVAYLLPIRVSACSTLIIVLAWFTMQSVKQQHLLWIEGLLYGLFHLFALLLATTHQREQQARVEIQNQHAQLQSTQHLLSELSKHSERTRIARDLHDLLGHHLTALSIKLQIAQRMTAETPAQQQIQECQSVAKLLLNDVRDAVDMLRQHRDIDFHQSLTLLLQHTPELKVHATIPQHIAVDDSHIAQVLLRCVQEAITNSLRHSHAKQFWIVMTQDEEKLFVDMHDDGYISEQWQKGNGLTGMSERVFECGGHLHLYEHNRALHYKIELSLTPQ
ncbi:sensor histidine kinase [Pseudoalteromonas piscicida]|uniref:Sensor histidine kinase n=1 Tax=Pseudoalteromonas piscicida TaxID=43662 RepID=A0AAQ2ITE0_PSEO7|nr:two-component system sensor protein [Pseudoalteromonas piscicida]TMN85251.1 sensor histidine kinase [Pseudoalteromonas flavipulchra]TMN38284.1 sensor histidine kinase [Pseudoalteromonas piscicida]TMN39568.1 sensor histidine kinase [Pseudoalteromonas piscicida]TMN50407.1 sensor histidine kinase [Pseudoalteromonas piscicida]